MKFRFIPGLVLAISTALAMFSGCDYEPPQVGVGGGGGETGGAGGGTSGSSSNGSSSGVAGGAVCLPADTLPCQYDGPPDTLGKGTCKGGVKTCSPGGTLTDCSASIVPTLEDCMAITDPNCDGHIGCTGTPIVVGPGEKLPGHDFVVGVAAGRGMNGYDGPVYAVGVRDGAYSGTDLSKATPLFFRRTSQGTFDDLSGSLTFVPGGGGNGVAVATSVAVVPGTEDVVVVGGYYGGKLVVNSVDLGGFATTPTGFVVAFDPSGKTKFAHMLGGPAGIVNMAATAADTQGNIYVTGSYGGAPDFGTVDPTPGDAEDTFVMSYSNTGVLNWMKEFKGSFNQSAKALAIAGDSDPVVALTFTGIMTIEQSDGQDASYDPMTGADILLLRLDPNDGRAKWHTSVACASGCKIGGVAADATKVALAGMFKGVISFGGNVISNDDPNDPSDSFIGVYNAQTGILGSVTALNDPARTSPQEVHGLAIDVFGDLVVAGTFAEWLSVDNNVVSTTTSSGDVNAFVLKKHDALGVRWARGFGDMAWQSAGAVAIGKTTGHVFLGGGFQSELTGVNPILVSSQEFDPFLIETTN